MSEWRRLDPRMVVVAPARMLVRLVPVLAIVLITGRGDDPTRYWFTLAIAGLVVVAGILRWRFTRYRITDDRVELHSGWIRRQRRSVPRDRIRTVDLTAGLLHRAFGLNVVHVRAAETGEHHGLELDAVTRAEGEVLRRELLGVGVRSATPGVGAAGPATTAPATAGSATPGPAVADSVTAGSATPGSATPGLTVAGSATAGSATPGPTVAGSATAGSATAGSATPAPGSATPATRASAPGIAALDHGATGPTPSSPIPLARLRWSWLRFAPLTFSSLAGLGAVAVAAFNLLTELGIRPERDLGPVAARLSTVPLWLVVGVAGVGLLVVAAVGSTVLFAERWWGYRLTRSAGTLHVRRGLLTLRSLSVAEDRLRGVAVHEPLLLRAGRGAQTHALATGLGRDAQGGVLQPPAPRAEAHRVAAAALALPTEAGPSAEPLAPPQPVSPTEPTETTETTQPATPTEPTHPDPTPPPQPSADPTRTPLVRHPPAALRRRFTRALGPAALIVLLAWGAGRLWPPAALLWLPALVLLPLATLLALDRYRALGHALTPKYLVTRLGGFSRRTVALRRDGVIGWRMRQSPFQRHAGVVTLEAVTAAGAGGYLVLDVEADKAAALIRDLSADASRTARG